MKINLIFYLVGLMLLFFTNSQQVYGQYIHKVCPSIPVGNYGVKGQLSSAYFWKVEGGQMIHSNGKDSIQVKWDFTQPKFSLAVVEVSASGCVGDTIFAQVQKGNDPAIFIVGHDSICVGNKTLLTAYGGMDYLWSTGQNQMTISSQILIDSAFFVIGFDGCGFDTAFYKVKALPNPKADFYFNPAEIIEFQPVVFNFSGSDATHFQWYIDNSLLNDDDNEVTHNFIGAGYHPVFLYVENEFQCWDTLSKKVIVLKNRTNSFTPNDDGVNDFWELDELKDFPNCRVWIFDRSGAELFYSEGYNTPWDGTFNGKPLPVGSYFYLIDFGVDDYTAKGIINLLR